MRVTEERFAAIRVESCLVWDIANSPDEALQHIASGLGLSRVLAADALRSALPSGLMVLAGRGTRAAVEAALEGLGYVVAFRSGLQHLLCDGSILADGEPYECGYDSHWAVCHLYLTATGVTLTTNQIDEVWRNVDYWGRKSVRHVLVVTDATGRHVYRNNATVPS
jgi:hypothetical protein